MHRVSLGLFLSEVYFHHKKTLIEILSRNDLMLIRARHAPADIWRNKFDDGLV